MIVFKAKKGNGGFGDRLVGLISCIFLSELTGEELFIDWADPSIDNFFTYNSISEYDLQNIRLFDLAEKTEFIEQLPDLKKYFSNRSIQSNLNFIDRLFVNQGIDRSFFEQKVLALYASLFEKYLTPKEMLLNRVNKNREQFAGKTIGVQLRMGDTYLNVGKYEGLNIDGIDEIFESIRSDQSFDSLFLTSDNQDVIDRVHEYFIDKNIIYDDTRIRHSDRMVTSDDEMLKVLSDMLTLSKTDFRYISLGSNFGRIANLIAKAPLSFKVISREGLLDVSLVDLITVKKDRRL